MYSFASILLCREGYPCSSRRCGQARSAASEKALGRPITKFSAEVDAPVGAPPNTLSAATSLRLEAAVARIPQLRSALGRLSLSRLRRRVRCDTRSRHRHRRRIDMSYSYYGFKISPSRLLAELRTSSSVSPLRRLLLAVSSVAVKDRDRTQDSVSLGRAARHIINEPFRLTGSVGPGPVGDSGTSSVLATYTVFNN